MSEARAPEDLLVASLTGAMLEEIRVKRCWVDGALLDGCNVLFLRARGRMLRLFFDHGVFFCRGAKESDFELPTDDDSELRYDLVEPEGAQLVIGQVIREARRVEVPAASVRLTFENGRTLTLTNTHDQNDLAIA